MEGEVYAGWPHSVCRSEIIYEILERVISNCWLIIRMLFNEQNIYKKLVTNFVAQDLFEEDLKYWSHQEIGDVSNKEHSEWGL